MIHKQTESTYEGRQANSIINKMLFRVRNSSLNNKAKPKQLKKYDIRQTIGDGSFGVVKKAVHLLTGQVVAVKICSVQNWSASKLKLLQSQISRQRQIMHQNIAQLYEVVRTSSKIYIFMEYCKNGELFERISKKGPIAQNEAARIFHQILSALIYLRQNNLSHRDIKPQNILFDHNWNVKLVDFGYVCFSAEDQFRTTLCGTATYMAPEIIKRLPYDAELADVWSLGVTLYAMLTAKLPFDGESFETKMRNIVNLKYCREPQLSFKAHKLIKCIFRQQSQRVRLQEILQSEFCCAYEVPTANCIDFRSESINLELDILNTLQEEGIDIVKLRQSVLDCKLDKYRALYFLTLQKQKESGNCRRLSVFNKHKKYAKSKLSSILIRKLQEMTTKDHSEEKPLPSRISTFRPNLRIKQVRLHTEMIKSHNFSHRRNTIDSPPKLAFKLTER